MVSKLRDTYCRKDHPTVGGLRQRRLIPTGRADQHEIISVKGAITGMRDAGVPLKANGREKVIAVIT